MKVTTAVRDPLEKDTSLSFVSNVKTKATTRDDMALSESIKEHYFLFISVSI